MPQGSRLGPLLFNFYIADLVEYCKTDGVKTKLYADDLKAYEIYSNHSGMHNLQAFINKLSEWCRINCLKIAPQKCSALYLGKNNLKTKYYIDSVQITEIDSSVRDLGVLITPDLKWKTHIDARCKSANIQLIRMFKAIRSKDPYFLKRMYVSYVRPLLEFALSICNPYLKKDIEKLEKVQILAVKMIYYRGFRDRNQFDYSVTLKRLGLRSLQERRLINGLVLFHKILHRKVSVQLDCIKDNASRDNRYSHLRLNIDVSKNNMRHHFFIEKMNRIYSKIYPKLLFSNAFIPSAALFKKRLLKIQVSEFLKM